MLANMAIDHDARAAVVGIARANDGFVSLTAARQADVSDKVLADMTRHGLLERVHLGLYRATSVPWSWEALQLAAVRAGGPRACAACSGAAGLLGLPGVPLGRPEIVVAGTRLLRIDGVRVHRTRELPDEDVTTVAGVRCTTGPRTLIDLAGRFSATHCIELVDAAIGAGIATRARLYERATALRNGRAGVGTLVEFTAPDAEGVFRSTLERASPGACADTVCPAPRSTGRCGCGAGCSCRTRCGRRTTSSRSSTACASTRRPPSGAETTSASTRSRNSACGSSSSRGGRCSTSSPPSRRRCAGRWVLQALVCHLSAPLERSGDTPPQEMTDRVRRRGVRLRRRGRGRR